MGSLSQLLAKDGFETHNNSNNNFNHKKLKFRKTSDHHDSIALPIYICHDSKSFDVPKLKKTVPRAGSSVVSSKVSRKPTNEPAIDEAATRAVISILTGYAAQYLRDKELRDSLRDKCFSCLVRRNDDRVFANMELGIESIEKLVDDPGTKNELKLKSLQNSIGFLTIVASLNSKESRNGTTFGTPNSHLSACAQLYLAIVYKLEKNDRISARHVLQVFIDSPFLARTSLLPDLWKHFFLPHLLHLKIWYNKQVENFSDFDSKDQEDEERRCLTKAYDDQMDMGTTQFALYYKEWLKTGAQPPANLPSVPLPSAKSWSSLQRNSSHSFASHSSINNFLYRAVFGASLEKQQSMPWIDYDDTGRSIAMEQKEEEKEEEVLHLDDYNSNQHRDYKSRLAARRRSSSESCRINSRKPDYTRFLPCQSLETETAVTKTRIITPSSDLSRAVFVICNSDSLHECQAAIRVMSTAWLTSHKNDPLVEKTLSKSSVIEGMLEVLFVSDNEEILELLISLLAEFVTRNETNGKIILSLDPQLEGFTRLMRNSSLFLKAASLLHLVMPAAKQMISAEWIPLVLRVLEFGDQTQTLFSVQCSPQVAAYYFLDQLLTGFDEDRNCENSRLVISLGGLSLLLRRMEVGDVVEKAKAASVVNCCIRADGRCRHYLANNLNPEFIFALLVHGKELECNQIALSLLVELVCLHRFTRRTEFFNGLLRGWGCLNAMQILLLSLQRATREERPLVASILLQLDLMGDPLKSSVYRAEAIEAIIEALDCQIFNEKVQEQAAKALSILGGRYTYTGTPEAEKWILKEAGYDESLEGAFHGRYHIHTVNNDDDNQETEHWQRKTAMVLWSSGSGKLIEVLGDSVANGIPCLSRASLVTVAWMSKFVHTIGDGDVLQSMTWSTLVRHLTRSLVRNNAMEERVLASFTLLNLSGSTGCVSEISDKEKKAMLVDLRNVSKVTWTAKKLTSIVAGSPMIRQHGP